MTKKTEVEMFVAGLVLDPASNAPIVILKNPETEVCLPIWIGLAEATAIASALKKVQLARPMTHDLLKNVLEQLGGRVVKVFIHGLEENTFLATIELVIGEVVKEIDSRPSDAIALAVRVGAPIFVSDEVLAEAQVTMVAVNSEEGGELETEEGAGSIEESSQGRRANFANIDKEKWEEILAEMDPTDFKYKM